MNSIDIAFSAIGPLPRNGRGKPSKQVLRKAETSGLADVEEVGTKDGLRENVLHGGDPAWHNRRKWEG